MLHALHRLRSRLAPAVVVIVAAPLAGSLPADAARPWADASLSPDDRAWALVEAMTLEEKAAMLYGSGPKVVGDQRWQVHVRGNERLGVPDLTMGDGPSGIRGGTQLPAPIGLAASWSREAASDYGDLLGTETRAMGYGVLLAPTVNLARDPRHGRTYDGLGEDPYLIGQLAAPLTAAIQQHDVIADVKHLAANNIEAFRQRLDVSVDERTLHQLYLPQFADVVRNGGVGSAMCAYNKINGVPSCDNDDLLVRLFRERWGFEGFVRTDYEAHHTTRSVGNGLDQELPREIVYGEELVAAVHAGRIPEAAVDTAAFRVLRTMIASGVYDDPPERTGIDVDAGAARAQSLAERSIVLLRNQDGVLPLDPATTGQIAVIGADADNTATFGGGSANNDPPRKDTILDAIRARVPGATVDFTRGVDPVAPASVLPGYPITPSSVLRANDGTTAGLTANYFRKTDFTDRIATRVDRCVCYDDGWYAGGGTVVPPPPGVPRAVRWTGTLTAPAAGAYRFDLSSVDSSRLYLDGQLVIDNSGVHDATPETATVTLGAGEARQVRVDYVINREDNPFVAGAGRQLKFGWRPADGVLDPGITAAAQAAQAADVAVVVVRDYQSETLDRVDLTLPNNQDALVRAVAAVNPRTVVVLTTGTAATLPWAAQVPAIVAARYGGTAGGAALAKVLFGDVSPSGRLPISFPADVTDLPTATARQYPGVNQHATYSEGLRVGYRHYNAPDGPAPAYPFGFGLSYTTFQYRNLSLDRSSFVGAAAGPDGTLRGLPGVTARVTVTNTGTRRGAAVAQAYVEFPAGTGEPAAQLQGFRKVWLDPGESTEVSIALDQQAFAIYAYAADQWRVPRGTFRIKVGDSSRSLPLSAPVDVTETIGAPRIGLTAPALATPGQPMTVAGTLYNDGTFAARNLTASLAAPAGWTVTGGEVPASVAAGASVPVTWEVTPPPAAGPQRARLTVTLGFTAGPSTATSVTTATTAVPHNRLAAAFNNWGVTEDADVDAGDLDGRQHTLSRQALAAAGYTPGTTVHAGGFTFTWPATATGGQADNVAAYRQTIRLTGRGDALGLLATSSRSDTAGRLTVHYTDGTRSEVLIRASDWWTNRAAPGSSVAVTMPYVNTVLALCAGGVLDGTRCRHDVSLYVLTVPLNAGKDVAAIELPQLSPTAKGPTATMHIFAAAIE